MHVYLVRHGIAAPRSNGEGSEDALRALTAEGVRRTRQIADALDELGVHFDEIWTSPLTRARQTAELLMRSSCKCEARSAEDLGPGGDQDRLLREMAELPDSSSIALVGHEPDLGLLAGRFLTGRSDSIVAFKKGGVACIELAGPAAPGSGRLLWMLTPKQMRKMT